MITVFFGTLIRHAPFHKGGELVRLDWDRKEIDAKAPVFPSNPDLEGLPNPRKTGQGCRGIEFYQDKILAANYHTIQIYDHELRHQGDIRHNLLADIHEIFINGSSRLYITSVVIDAVLDYNLESGRVENEYWPREVTEFQQALHLSPLDLDKKADIRVRFLGAMQNKRPGHLHLNTTACWRGEVYALFNAYGVVVNLSTGKIILQDPALKGGHNLKITDEGIAILNDTRGRTVRFYDMKAKKLVKTIRLTDFSWVRSLKKQALKMAFYKWPQKVTRKLFKISGRPVAPLFLRGLDVVDNMIFIGMSPASIVCLDWWKEEFIDGYCYSKNLRHCIHGLRVLKN